MERAIMTQFTRIRRFLNGEGGMAAAEFGLLLPVFALCLLGMLDVGLAVNERMYLDRVVRAGGQLAMSGVDDIAELEGAVVNSGENDTQDADVPSVDTVDYTLSITRSCECGGSAGSCTARCDGGEPPSLFYNFSAKQMMETILLPEFEVESTLRVQLR